ncbi:MAG: MFS transporter [Candidatus Andersenbacteria bacterium]|nr:MFS transporter [Candidatus Andersenbacteria bacterium]
MNHKEIKLFYASNSIFTFASSIIGIFIPLYLFEKGFSLSLIILFFVITQFSRLIFLPVSAWLSSAIGAKKIIGLSFVVSIIFYLILDKIDYLSNGFYLSALIYGIVHAFFYLPFLVHLSKMSPDNNRGKILGKFNIFLAIAGALGPILGGIIISSYGFSAGFSTVIVFLVPAILLLLLTPEISKIRKINFRIINIKKIYPDLIANGFLNFQIFLSYAVWPIFIFLIVSEYDRVGLIQTISLFVSIVVFYVLGIWVDKFDRKKILLWGSLFSFFADIMRVFASSFASVLLLNTSSVAFEKAKRMAWDAKIQEHMDREPRTEYICFFEIGGTFVAFILLILFMLLIQSFSLKDALFCGIIISSLSGIFINLIRK